MYMIFYSPEYVTYNLCTQCMYLFVHVHIYVGSSVAYLLLFDS